MRIQLENIVINMKRYLLTVGDDYYSCSGTGNWIEFFKSSEEAKRFLLEKIESGNWEDYPDVTAFEMPDWYCIIDLENWKESKVRSIYNYEEY